MHKHNFGDASTFIFDLQDYHARCIAWSPDSTRIAIGSLGGAVSVWSATTGSRICKLHSGQARVDHVSWSPDSSQLAVVFGEGTLSVLAAVDLHIVHMHTAAVASNSCVAWLPDNTLLAASSPKPLRSCDTSASSICVWSGFRLLHELRTTVCYGMTMSTDQLVSVHSGLPVCVWSIAHGTLLFELHLQHVWLRATSIHVCIVIDTKQIVAETDDAVVHVWSAKNGDLLRKIPLYCKNYSQLVPNSTQVVCAAFFTAKAVALCLPVMHLQSLVSGRTTHLFYGYPESIVSAALSPDGTRLFSASHEGSACIWTLCKWSPVRHHLFSNAEFRQRVLALLCCCVSDLNFDCLIEVIRQMINT